MKTNPPFVSLRPEITRADALTLMDWLQDESVIRHLSDSRHVSRFIGQVLDRVHLPVLTHLFNQGGRFFMVCDRHDRPVGFVRLVQTAADCELVLLIGQPEHWGRRFGASALGEAMKIAFFEMRAAKLVARIHADNARSLTLFQRCGFRPEGQANALACFVLGAQRYLRLLREGEAGHAGGICITEVDQARLRNLIALEQPSAVFELEHEIERALVVDPRQVPRDVVTMNSQALLQLDGEEREVALVYPEDADDGAGKLSICSDLGTAILGYRAGDGFDWRVADRTCHIRIGKVLYQPEAAGDFHL
ncbi:MAG: GNAT family N-acetyltransferase [Rubrivivax sp.]|nr:GNAT family N-acetyltransferase [Rubrivivax sp.]